MSMLEPVREFYRRHMKGTRCGHFAVRSYIFLEQAGHLISNLAKFVRYLREYRGSISQRFNKRLLRSAAFRDATRCALLIFGEALAYFSRRLGKLSALMLFKAQWRYGTPEWFDARLGLLYPEKWFTDGSHVSRGNIVGVLPIGGSILDLCGGDGFLPYYVYSRRAAKVVSVDYDSTAHKHALRHHNKRNITYILGDVLSFNPGSEKFDVVAIRGAIEHFSEEEQQKIFRLAWDALKPGGWFCGDTPARAEGRARLLEHHDYEWSNEDEMRRLLLSVFDCAETFTFQSAEAISYTDDHANFNVENIRTTLLWRCRKSR